MAENGCVWEFHPSYSAVKGDSVDIESYLVLLTDTANMAHHLIEHLPRWHPKRSFTLHMHNFFQTQSLLAEPCRIGIGPCITRRQQFWEFPMRVQAGNDAKLPYHCGSGAFNDGVAILLWMDSSPVTMRSTIHPLSGENSLLLKMRIHPGNKSTNASRANFTYFSGEC